MIFYKHNESHGKISTHYYMDKAVYKTGILHYPLFVNKINKQYLGEKGKKKGQKDIGYTPKF